MINQLKKNTTPLPKIEEVVLPANIQTPSKFQRINRKTGNTPEQTNATSEKTQSVITQQLKVEPPLTDRAKPFARSARVLQKRQVAKSPVIEQQQEPVRIQRIKTSVQMTHNIQTPQIKQVKSTMLKKQESSPNIMKGVAQRTKTEEAPAIQTITLKKSSVFLFIVNRIFKESLLRTLLKVKENKNLKRIKNDNEARVLLLRSCQLQKKYQFGLYRQAVERFKIIFSKKLKELSNSTGQIEKVNAAKVKQNIINILHITSKIKLRETFNKLKKMLVYKQNCFRAAPTLVDFYQRRKIRQVFELLKERSVLKFFRKKFLLNQVSNAFTHCSRQMLIKGFNRLMLVASATKIQINEPKSQQTPVKNQTIKNNVAPSPSVPAVSQKTTQLTKKIEKLGSDRQKCQQDINSAEGKIEQQKRKQQIEAKKLKKTIEQLKASKKKIQKEVSDKKVASQSLKKQMKGGNKVLSSDQNQAKDNEEKAQNQLNILQQLYSDVSKTSNQEVKANFDRILRENKIDKRKVSKINQQWDLIKKRTLLQKQIQVYETSILGESPVQKDHNSIVKGIRQENEMVRNMIKNYIKERYLWSEVQKFVAAVI